jgi:hypothetical protein
MNKKDVKTIVDQWRDKCIWMRRPSSDYVWIWIMKTPKHNYKYSAYTAIQSCLIFWLALVFLMFQVHICPYNILLLFFADIVRLKKVSILGFSRHDAKRSSRRACRCLCKPHIRELTNRHGFCSLCGRWPSLTIPLNDTEWYMFTSLARTLQYPCILFRDAVGWTDTKVRDMNRIVHCAQKSLWCDV